MAVLIDSTTQVIVQGLTGKEGIRASMWMRNYKTNVVAGVTPGKGGLTVGGFPIFNSMKEARQAFPLATCSSVYVPPKFVKTAVKEAIESGCTLVHVFAEGVPVYDSAYCIALAKQHNVTLLGPSSIGMLIPDTGKIGSIGGDTNDQFTKGNVAIISKSGGLSSEFSLLLSKRGLGQSAVIGIGGDQLIGTTYADLFSLLEADHETKVVLLIGELGGSYEEEAAQAINDKKLTKPVVAFISGLFAQTLPQGVSFGHAGAIVDKNTGTRSGKIDALQRAGVLVANTPQEVVRHIQSILQNPLIS